MECIRVALDEWSEELRQQGAALVSVCAECDEYSSVMNDLTDNNI
jgi:hypothetical protein